MFRCTCSARFKFEFQLNLFLPSSQTEKKTWADRVEEDIARLRAESARNAATRQQTENETPNNDAALLRGADHDASAAEPLEDEVIWLPKFNRIKQEFHQALEGPEFEPCRKALGENGKS